MASWKVDFGRRVVSCVICFAMLGMQVLPVFGADLQSELTASTLDSDFQQQSCGVGEGPGVPQSVTRAFVDAYERNGDAGVIGQPVDCVHHWSNSDDTWTQGFPDMPEWGKSVILWNEDKQKAYIVHGWIFDRYANIGDPKNGPESWLGGPISDEMIAPVDYYFEKKDMPLQYFERGYIGWSTSSSRYRAATYYPAICDVQLNVIDVGDNKVDVDVKAYVNRAPGWPTADQSSDPTNVTFSLVFPDNSQEWEFLTSTDGKNFSGTWEDLPADETVHFYFDAWNLKGVV